MQVCLDTVPTQLEMLRCSDALQTANVTSCDASKLHALHTGVCLVRLADDWPGSPPSEASQTEMRRELSRRLFKGLVLVAIHHANVCVLQLGFLINDLLHLGGCSSCCSTKTPTEHATAALRLSKEATRALSKEPSRTGLSKEPAASVAKEATLTLSVLSEKAAATALAEIPKPTTTATASATSKQAARAWLCSKHSATCISEGAALRAEESSSTILAEHSSGIGIGPKHSATRVAASAPTQKSFYEPPTKQTTAIAEASAAKASLRLTEHPSEPRLKCSYQTARSTSNPANRNKASRAHPRTIRHVT